MLAQQVISYSLATNWSGPHFPYAAITALVAGFLGAVSIGSIAWYNSRRPMGWEGKEKPNFVPDVER